MYWVLLCYNDVVDLLKKGKYGFDSSDVTQLRGLGTSHGLPSKNDRLRRPDRLRTELQTRYFARKSELLIDDIHCLGSVNV